ncbi:MAG TPA: hypothetical protein VLZ83_03000 [Edaphocola sp.]|nr:hypothetical protein [Edaphocola sp.]
MHIEKELAVKKELEKLSLRVTTDLMIGRREIFCLWFAFLEFMVWKILWHLKNGITRIAIEDDFSRNRLLHSLVEALNNRY